MKRSDRIKLSLSRNWNFPGKERLSAWLKTSPALKTSLHNGIIWLSNENIAIYTTADNFIEHTILSTGTYEDEIGKLIAISLKAGYVALDIGGNIGLQSIRMSQCVGDAGKVYTFEPLTYLQKKFSRNIALNNCSNVKLFPLALSDNDDNITVTISENNWNQGSFSLKQLNGGSTLQNIAVRVGDDLSQIQELARLDLVKIDVEGFEYHVLRGLSQTLKKHKPRIILEYDVNYWINTGQSMPECFDFLTNMNYAVYQVTAFGCELITDRAAVADGNLFCIPVANG